MFVERQVCLSERIEDVAGLLSGVSDGYAK
jgi:hypothetical protein